MKHILTIFAVAGLLGMAEAAQLTSRSELDSLLGVNQILEDFESLSIPYAENISAKASLYSSTLFSGQGPGLVEEGVYFRDVGFNGILFWNGDGYYGLNSQTLTAADTLKIVFTTPVDAFGFDMQNYVGYGMAGTISIYDNLGGLIGTSNVNGGFFGWENVAGNEIDTVYIDPDFGDYIMIDNLGYGVIPEPSSLAMIGLVGSLGVFVRRRLMW